MCINWGAIHAKWCWYRCTECYGFYQVGGLTCIDNTCSNNNWNPITLFFKMWMLNDLQCHKLKWKATNGLAILATLSWSMAWMRQLQSVFKQIQCCPLIQWLCIEIIINRYYYNNWSKHISNVTKIGLKYRPTVQVSNNRMCKEMATYQLWSCMRRAASIW